MTFQLRKLHYYSKDGSVFYQNKQLTSGNDVIDALSSGVDDLENFWEFVEMSTRFNEKDSRTKLHCLANPIDIMPFFLEYQTLRCIQKSKNISQDGIIKTYIENVEYYYDRGDRYDPATQHLEIDGELYYIQIKNDELVIPKYFFDFALLSDIYILHQTWLLLKKYHFNGDMNTVLTDVGQRRYTHHDLHEVLKQKEHLGLSDKDIVEYLQRTPHIHSSEIDVHV